MCWVRARSYPCELCGRLTRIHICDEAALEAEKLLFRPQDDVKGPQMRINKCEKNFPFPLCRKISRNDCDTRPAFNHKSTLILKTIFVTIAYRRGWGERWRCGKRVKKVLSNTYHSEVRIKAADDRLAQLSEKHDQNIKFRFLQLPKTEKKSWFT